MKFFEVEAPWARWAALGAWAAFALFLVWGYPPPVDLPAHGAQLETLVQWLKGDAAVRSTFELHFPLGYGLEYWLFLPLAWVANGAVAVKAALWTAVVLWPVALVKLLRAFGRPWQSVVLGAPLAFNISYWYGLLPCLFSQPLALFTLAAYVEVLKAPGALRERGKALFLVNLLAGATFQAHLVFFCAIALAMGAVTVLQRPLTRAAVTFAACLTVPTLLSLGKAIPMAKRAVVPGDYPATEYAAMSHINWFFKNYRPEGSLAAVLPLFVTLGFVAVYLSRRKEEPKEPLVAFAALVLLYAVTPKTLSGIFLISVRLPVLAGALAITLVPFGELPKAFRQLAFALTALSLLETGWFTHLFRAETDGLSQMMEGPPPGRHGYASLEGNTILGSKQIYLEHLGQWLTATRGGLGQNFFTDAEHHPVRLRPDRELPSMAELDTLLLYGEGPAPAELLEWRVQAESGRWRKLTR